MNEIYIHYLLLACYPLFFFGAIKLRKNNNTRARRLLVLGFAIVSLTSIFSLAQYLEVFELNYDPYMENNYGMSGWQRPAWTRLHKLIYWGVFWINLCGEAIAALGFFLEAKYQISVQCKIEQDLHRV